MSVIGGGWQVGFCVEDDKEILSLMNYTLTTAGYDVKGFSNGAAEPAAWQWEAFGLQLVKKRKKGWGRGKTVICYKKDLFIGIIQKKRNLVQIGIRIQEPGSSGRKSHISRVFYQMQHFQRNHVLVLPTDSWILIPGSFTLMFPLTQLFRYCWANSICIIKKTSTPTFPGAEPTKVGAFFVGRISLLWGKLRSWLSLWGNAAN